MKLIKNIKIGKANFLKLFIIVIFIFYSSNVNSLENSESLEGNFIEIKILDKVSSKNNVLKIKIGEEQKFKNLLIKSLKCKNSEFDDNPEITAYLQVKDLTNKNNDEVFIFNGWTFLQVLLLNLLITLFMIFGLQNVTKQSFHYLTSQH